MKLRFKTIAMVLAFLGLQEGVSAQGLMPAASSTQTVVQDFGLGKVTLSYSRPNVKGRTVFGGMEPYGAVWRTGANTATTLTFTDEVTIGGKTLPAGEYALFTIPGQQEWTIILNQNPKQWGAYTYKESDDVLRFKVKPVLLKDKVETFTIQFANMYPTKGQIQLMWENTLVSFDLSTDIDARVMAGIEKAMTGEKKPYFQAAQYYFENGKDLQQALNWVNEAEKESPKAPWIKLWKGRIQLKMGDRSGAKVTAQAGIDAAKEANNEEYIRLNTQLLKQAGE